MAGNMGAYRRDLWEGYGSPAKGRAWEPSEITEFYQDAIVQTARRFHEMNWWIDNKSPDRHAMNRMAGARPHLYRILITMYSEHLFEKQKVRKPTEGFYGEWVQNWNAEAYKTARDMIAQLHDFGEGVPVSILRQTGANKEANERCRHLDHVVRYVKRL